jgi:hypothetical protein
MKAVFLRIVSESLPDYTALRPSKHNSFYRAFFRVRCSTLARPIENTQPNVADGEPSRVPQSTCHCWVCRNVQYNCDDDAEEDATMTHRRVTVQTGLSVNACELQSGGNRFEFLQGHRLSPVRFLVGLPVSPSRKLHAYP